MNIFYALIIIIYSTSGVAIEKVYFKKDADCKFAENIVAQNCSSMRGTYKTMCIPFVEK